MSYTITAGAGSVSVSGTALLQRSMKDTKSLTDITGVKSIVTGVK